MKKLMSILMVIFLMPACFGGLMQKCNGKKAFISEYKNGIYKKNVCVINYCTSR